MAQGPPGVFGVLGPVTVTRDGVEARFRTPMVARLLAALLVRANEPVPAEALIDALWGEAPPGAAGKTLRVYVHQLRTVLDDGQLTRGPAGYRLAVDDDRLDAARFADGVARARAAARGGAHDTASDAYAAALALWRGPAYADATGSAAVAAEAARLDAERVDAIEEWLGTLLALDRPADVATRARSLLAEHPFRERLREHLMRALHATGRTAEALEVFRETRALFIDELGAEPGADLRRLNLDILRAAGGGPPPGIAPIPRHLPPDVVDFTGRADLLAMLDAASARRSATAGAVVVLSGPGGVGKTALAVHWAYRCADRFPDGQLYVNLRGYGAGGRVRVIDALARMIRALGVPAEGIPLDEADAADLYRSLTADRRLCVVIDNAATVEQVRPLLPAGGGATTIVTSREHLSGLIARDGARRVPVGPLTDADAVATLAAVLGEERVATEPDAVTDLASLTGNLPLALRIVAANLSGNPHRRLAAYADSLRAGGLATLVVDGDESNAVRVAFDGSYDALAAPQQRMFRLISLLPGPFVTAGGAAAAAGEPLDRAARLLRDLANAHLVEASRYDRYTLHDLIRRYAAERAADDDTDDDRRAAVTRLREHYLRSARSAARTLLPHSTRLEHRPEPPPFPTPDAARAFLDAEMPNLVAVVQDAADTGDHRTAWMVADALRGQFWLRMTRVPWLAVAEAATRAAIADGDPGALAASHLSLADVNANGENATVAADGYRRAAAFAAAAGLDGMRLAAMSNLAVLHWQAGDMRLAADLVAESLELARQVGDDVRETIATTNRAGLLAMLGRFRAAFDLLTGGRQRHLITGNVNGLANVERMLALVYTDAGQPRAALGHAEAALRAAAEGSDRRVEIFARIAHAEACRALGRFDDAYDGFEVALDAARALQFRYGETEALIGLAGTRADRDGPATLGDLADRAVGSARTRGYAVLESIALVLRSRVRLARGDLAGATADAERARRLDHDRGYLIGEVAALRQLSAVRRALGDVAGADDALADADAVATALEPFKDDPHDR